MTEVAKIPALVADHWGWQVNASCRGMSANAFFNPDNERGRSKRNREARAKSICDTCPVINRCLDWALQVREPYGIWGGTTPVEREGILVGRRTYADPGRVARAG